MKRIKYFYIPGCPYCRQADKIIEQIIEKNSDYKKLVIEKINEYERSEIAEQYDYYYTPAMFINDIKIYESHPGEMEEECRQNVEKVLALAAMGK